MCAHNHILYCLLQRTLVDRIVFMASRLMYKTTVVAFIRRRQTATIYRNLQPS